MSEEVRKRVLEIIQSPEVSSETLEGLPESCSESLDWNLLGILYQKLASGFEDSGRLEEASIALSRAARLSEGRNPELNAGLQRMKLDPLNPSPEEILAWMTHSRAERLEKETEEGLEEEELEE